MRVLLGEVNFVAGRVRTLSFSKMKSKMIRGGLLGLVLVLAGLVPQAPTQARAIADHEPRLNPSPQLHYTVQAVVHAAPGPFERVEGHVNYSVVTPACVPLTPVTGATVVPEKRVPVAFIPAGDNAYKADVVLDRFLDEDYFGQGVCRWSIVGITVELHHSKVMFSPALYDEDFLAGKKVTRFFSVRSYGHAENARIDIGATNASAFDNPDATFSISMQADRAVPN
uniref:hypothetical protein n=1 Tax=Bordetella sputigena TaxID=1416810 RepID=UPI0039EFBE25